MKKYYLLYVLAALMILSCTRHSYISEDVYYSVDFDETPTTKPKTKSKEKENSKTTVTETKPKEIYVPKTDNIVVTDRNEKLNSVIKFANTFLGAKYKYGGTTPAGFDCSGFVMYVFTNSGIDMPRNTPDMLKISDKIDKKDILPGDLVFFKGRNLNSNDIGHVALVCEKTDNSFKIIHSTTSKGVIVNDFEQFEYWKVRFLFATRIKDEYLQ